MTFIHDGSTLDACAFKSKCGLDLWGTNNLLTLRATHRPSRERRPEGTNENTELLNVKLYYSALKLLLNVANLLALDLFGKNYVLTNRYLNENGGYVLDHNARNVTSKIMILNTLYLS